MEPMVKANLSSILSGLKDQQEELGRLALSLEAVIASLKVLNPRFESEYHNQEESPDRDLTRQSTEHTLGLIEAVIQTLNKS